MALSSTQTALCNQLVGKYDGIINPVKASKGNIKSKIRSLISGLDGAVYSSIGDLQDEIDTLQGKVTGVIPGSTSTDISEIEAFLKNCSLFDIEQSKVATVKGSNISIFNKIDEFIQDSALIYEEFGLAAIADQINKLLSGSSYPNGNNVSGSLSNLDLLINCLSSLCPGYESTVITYQTNTSSLYNELHIVDDPLSSKYGQLDYDYVYSEAGMSSSQIDNMNFVINGITSIKENTLTSIDASVAAIKNSLNGGLV